MKMHTLKNISTLLTTLAVIVGTLPLTAAQGSVSHDNQHKQKFVDHVEDALTVINRSLFFWRQQAGYFRTGAIIIGSVPSADQTSLLNSLNANTAELATSMGSFYTQSNPNPTQAALITNLVNQYTAAEQTYEKDVIAESGAQFQDLTTWNLIGSQLAQALVTSNPKANLSILQKGIAHLIAVQSTVIQQLALGNFPTALEHAQQAVEIADQIGTYLGREIALQKQLIARRKLDIIVPFPF